CGRVNFELEQGSNGCDCSYSTPTGRTKPLVESDCAADAIYVKLKTNQTFEGHVQVKFVVQKSCYQVLVTNNQIEVLVPHEECAVPRRRSRSPAGIFLETAISVSFHPDFTTADDRIFHLRCFHQRATNSKALGPGSPTESQRDAMRTPSCSYTVRKRPNGPLAGTVMLGQVVFHQWSCENQQDTCLIVHSCSVVGGETKHGLMDADGCSKNTKILPNLVYLNPVGFHCSRSRCFRFPHWSASQFSTPTKRTFSGAFCVFTNALLNLEVIAERYRISWIRRK
uniref:ZP domain-containing protein n=1 Tax=Angiostrongylus cantonensis TaxID=6313 RepID=A0A0K0DFH4_ANGCA